MKSKTRLLIFGFAVVALLAALALLRWPSVQTEAASPGAQGGTAQANPCGGLTGRELERCRIQTWYASEPRQYEKGPDGNQVDASANEARAARGSGVEGVTSGGTTTAPPR